MLLLEYESGSSLPTSIIVERQGSESLGLDVLANLPKVLARWYVSNMTLSKCFCLSKETRSERCSLYRNTQFFHVHFLPLFFLNALVRIMPRMIRNVAMI
jgi:hypothetical protein